MADFTCPQCNKVLYSEEALQQHIAAKHAVAHSEKKPRKLKAPLLLGIAVILVIVGVYAAMSVRPAAYVPQTEDADHVLGNPAGLVTVTEFSDFQCPFCARFSRDTKPQIEDQFLNTADSQVKFVYKHFPLPSHTNAPKAAEAAECASDIGGESAFWEMHDKLFANNNFLSVSNLKKFAGELDLNQSAFDSCLDSGAMRSRVQKDQEEGRKLGVSATPGFFVNGQKIEGAQPFTVFKNAIESKLRAAQPPAQPTEPTEPTEPTLPAEPA